MYLIYKTTKRPIKDILQLSKEQIEWLLYNIQKDKEEQIKLIETVIDNLKAYINPDMYNKEQKMKKETAHKTVLDEMLKKEFKNKGLSDQELRELEKVFNQ